MAATKNRAHTPLTTSVFKMTQAPRFKATDGYLISELPIGHFIESIYELIEMSVEGYDELSDMLTGGDEYLILRRAEAFDFATNKTFIEIVVMDYTGNSHTVTVDEEKHPEARLNVSRQSYAYTRSDM